MATDEEAIVREGIDVLVNFLEHPGFKIMQARLDADKFNAMLALSEIDPEKTKEIIRLQEIVARADYYLATVEELIRLGQSEEDLQEMEEHSEYDGNSTEE